ncbi:host specificity protein J [Pandoraea pneumonica]|uniref:Host specificity protein J n=1 Tax=Pandoraea pneumonica TaxID=2508299 RepID=A0A5E4RLF1_9BURK|nr:phage tail protein [Pandoraea pneumonica]VVD64137.1 host specificity protein J [Pandoraea pneumonica]
MKHIIGYGGGGKSGGENRSPVESPDSLHNISYARILIALGEGEFGGLVNGMQSVFIDGTPILNPDGSSNFQNVTVDFRPGTQDQPYIEGFPEVENETSVGAALTSAIPWARSFTNLQLSAVRVTLAVPALSQANTSNGDITGYRIEYVVELSTDGGSFEPIAATAFDGKTTSKYQRNHRINLPHAVSGWVIRVRRITPNANSSTVNDTTTVESFTEIIDAKLRYPTTALLGVQVDARQFNRIPTISADMRMRLARVPSNYDPQTRTYAGTWDGSFKSAWTDNPAWVFYDYVLNERFGLGHRVTPAQVDKWSLYLIAQYCDELVDDGKGGQEPRFTCNSYVQSRTDAYKILQDIASVFRGMAYWSNGNVIAVADMPSDPVYSFTNANVIDGTFKYAGSSWKARKTVALVSWNDPADFYKAKVEYVEDQDGIARYGIQQTETTAFGCTSQGQAQRVGHWTLLTSRIETETISFSVGLEEAMVSPGSVISVADASRAGRRIGGRVASAIGVTVVLDKADQITHGDSLTVILPSGTRQTRTVQSVSGNAVTVSANWTEAVRAESVWTVESANLKSQLFRVLSISQGDGLTWSITALQHNPDKYDAIDSGTRLQQRPISVIPPSVQAPPSGVMWDSYSVISQGFATTTGVIKWTTADKAVAYDVEWRRDNSEWVKAGRTGSQSIEIPGLFAGTYVSRVTAISALDTPSIPAYSVATELSGKTTPPPTVTRFVTTGIVFGIRQDWGFPTGALDVERTEVWCSQTSDRADAIKLADFAYPQNTNTIMGMAAGVRLFFWARLVDKSGNIGEFYPTGAGVQGQSSDDAGEILDYLAGKIGSTQLAQDLASRIDLIDAPPGVAGSVNQRVLEEAEARQAAVSSEQSARQEADASLGQRIDTVTAGVGGNAAAIQQEATARANGDTALGQRIDTVVAGVAGNTAAVTAEATARADADSAMATRIDGVYAQLNPPMAGSTGDYAGATTAFAGVWSEQSARATADMALGIRVDNVQATLDTTSAQVQTTAQALVALDGKVSASFQMKVGVTAGGLYYGAGIGIGVSNDNGPIQSQILFTADRFGFINLINGTVSTPFVIENGQTFISQAIIGTGRITNAMIGDYIQSNNYQEGVSGWRLDKGGSLYMNGVNGGGRVVLSPNGLYVYDENGVLRVKLGKL